MRTRSHTHDSLDISAQCMDIAYPMATKTADTQLADDIRTLLRDPFPGIEVKVAFSNRWRRMCVTFTWAGFDDMLPEERFHRLVQCIPDDFRRTRMADFAWLELSPDEMISDFLKLPRSEDLTDQQEKSIVETLHNEGFFTALESAMQPNPQEACAGGLTLSTSLLTQKGADTGRVHQVKLAFIKQGVYCDCQVLASIRPRAERAAGYRKAQ